MMRRLFIAMFGLMLSTQALAQSGHDARVSKRAFVDGAIVRLEGCLNFQTMITFGAGEKIENVGLGDSNQWQVLPNKRADLLFVKPLIPQAYSNMTVVTDRHTYGFELKMASDLACRRGQVVYNLTFIYPEEVKAEAVPAVDLESLLPVPEKRNNAYTYQGDKTLVPVRLFDDGASTFFRWSEGVAAPAVYALGADNTESLINYANRGDYVVVEQVARGFVLRRGTQSAIVYNEAFVVPALDALSPQPRPDAKAAKKMKKAEATLPHPAKPSAEAVTRSPWSHQ
jgi:type IV secretion system protein VirB9